MPRCISTTPDFTELVSTLTDGAAAFQEAYSRAQALDAAGEPDALMSTTVPKPSIFSARGSRSFPAPITSIRGEAANCGRRRVPGCWPPACTRRRSLESASRAFREVPWCRSAGEAILARFFSLGECVAEPGPASKQESPGSRRAHASHHHRKQSPRRGRPLRRRALERRPGRAVPAQARLRAR